MFYATRPPARFWVTSHAPENMIKDTYAPEKQTVKLPPAAVISDKHEWIN